MDDSGYNANVHYGAFGTTAPETKADEPRSRSLSKGDGGGTFGGMNERIARLEEQMVGVRSDLRDIKDLLKVLPTLASKSDIASWKLQWTALLVATFAVVVGSIIGGLGWLETRAARVQTPAAAAAPTPQPIIIQIPTLTTRARR